MDATGKKARPAREVWRTGCSLMSGFSSSRRCSLRHEPAELRDFYARMQHTPLDIAGDFAAFEGEAEPAVTGGSTTCASRPWMRLEADALQRRYHQATTTMLARVWTRQLGFLTGMILALVGAAFVLGRLREPATRLSAAGGGITGALGASSPGLVLALLGTGLMAITLVTPFDVETSTDGLYRRASRPPCHRCRRSGGPRRRRRRPRGSPAAASREGAGGAPDPPSPRSFSGCSGLAEAQVARAARSSTPAGRPGMRPTIRPPSRCSPRSRGAVRARGGGRLHARHQRLPHARVGDYGERVLDWMLYAYALTLEEPPGG